MKGSSTNNTWLPLDKLICFMTFFLLLVDSVNGVVLNINPDLALTPSQAYKMILVTLFMIRIMTLSLPSTIYSFVLISCFAITIIYNFLLHDTGGGLMQDLVISFKTLSIPLAFLYFKHIAKRLPGFTDWAFQRFVVINFVVLGLNLFAGQLGYGYIQYEQASVGTSGFLYAGNEISVVLVVLATVIFYLIWRKKQSFYILFGILSLYFAILLVTKVAMLGILLVMTLIPLLSERDRLFTLTKLKLNHFTFFTILSPLVLGMIVYGIFETGLMAKMTRSYMEKQDFIQFILSSRDILLHRAMEVYSEAYNAFDYIFGMGKTRFTEIMMAYHQKEISTVEIDFFDILLYFGVVGVVLIFSFWFYLVVTSFVKTMTSPNFYAPAIFLIDILLLLISSTAGHVMHSGTAAIFIGFTNGMIFYPFAEPSPRNS